MKKLNLENIERNVTFSRIYGLNQVWAENKKWSCVGEPRDQHGLLYVFCDSVTLACKEKSTPLCFAQGNLVYIPKGSEYTIEFFSDKDAAKSILVNFDICDTAGNEYYIEEEITCIIPTLSAKIIDCMFAIANLSTNLAHPTVPVAKVFYEMLDKIIHYLHATHLHATEKDSVLPAVFYIDSHVLDDISVPQLAQMCLLNESAFRKAFKAHTGMNPVQYKMQIKINKAKLLLRSSSEIPIETIAETLGFYDNAYFHKVFVKCTGKTPKQYRDAHR